MGENEKAISVYTQAIEKENFVKETALLKRAISLIDLKDLDQAFQDLSEVLTMD
jgi:hypothetical protein